MKRLILVGMAMVLLSGCTQILATGTVRKQVDTPAFQASIQPVRTLRVLILSNQREEDLEQLIADVSKETEQGVGIRLQPIGYANISKPVVGTPSGALSAMHRAATDLHITFDIAITPWGMIGMDAAGPLLGVMMGATDDTWRRYIVYRFGGKYVLLHEFYHTLLLTKGHTTCIMDSGILYPFTSRCYWLRTEDWQEVMFNKWRDFSKKPLVNPDYQTDMIREK